MFGIVGWIVFGLVVGAIAKLVMPGDDPGGIIVTIVLGIVGAALGGFIGRGIGLYGPEQPAGFFMAFLGAIVLLALYRMTRRRAISSRRPLPTHPPRWSPDAGGAGDGVAGR
jgi:uncharacterized membrane protein YeaQ/YmgE (transglycosylase-associated protein family)